MLACRQESPAENVRGTVGVVIPETRIRIVNPETLEDLPDGEKGVVLAKGPGVMRGYYKDPENTAKAMKAGQGWFDTGDIGWRAPGRESLLFSSAPGSHIRACFVQDHDSQGRHRPQMQPASSHMPFYLEYSRSATVSFISQ